MGDLPRLMFAAPSSGSGKTTVTLAFLQALKSRGMRPAAFKCGPDYIDPMFHRKVLGLSGYNLDLFLASSDVVRGLLCRGSRDMDISVLEGVMGYYDGAGMQGEASSWRTAVETSTPVVLVVNSRGASLSLAALVKGFLHFRENSMLRGIILNNCSEGMYRHVFQAIERETGLQVYGYLPPVPQASLESRHLGLVTPGEVEDITAKVTHLGIRASETLDMDGLISLSRAARPIEGGLPGIQEVATGVPIAIAQDEAFCFYYRENLELLEAYGAKLVPFSPLHDTAVPAGAAGLYIGGGYPELFAAALSGNTAMQEAVRAAVQGGLPTLAECGGFMYLQQTIQDKRGRDWPMAGILPGASRNTGKLSRFGYVTLYPPGDTFWCKAGESVRAHEFHYWDSSDNGGDFVAGKPHSERSWRCIHAGERLFAGYPHLYFWSNPSFAGRFVKMAEGYTHRI